MILSLLAVYSNNTSVNYEPTALHTLHTERWIFKLNKSVQLNHSFSFIRWNLFHESWVRLACDLTLHVYNWFVYSNFSQGHTNIFIALWIYSLSWWNSLKKYSNWGSSTNMLLKSLLIINPSFICLRILILWLLEKATLGYITPPLFPSFLRSDQPIKAGMN